MRSYIFWKPVFDFTVALITIITLLPFYVALFILSSIDVRSFGIFSQIRIGQFGIPFRIYKFKTINPKTNIISSYGRFLRKYKIDELPQFFNIIKGEMSLVGPRPDIPGYYDKLQGKEKEILKLKPGITSQASIVFINEEELIEKTPDPETYNDEIIFPEKVKMNLEYLDRISLREDLRIVLQTLSTYSKK
jgi:lipopolysaccharide/colanic/teichoic acid biosynthesis glycosyltransferase